MQPKLAGKPKSSPRGAIQMSDQCANTAIGGVFLAMALLFTPLCATGAEGDKKPPAADVADLMKRDLIGGSGKESSCLP